MYYREYGTYPRSRFIHPFACRDSESVERSVTDLRRSIREVDGMYCFFHNNDLELMDFVSQNMGCDFHDSVLRCRKIADQLMIQHLDLPPATFNTTRARL